ncbi:MAG: hypothetical protein ABSA76_14005, partial [Bacteroidales bacterium]
LKFLGAILFVNVYFSVSGQQATGGWEKWKYLIGEWVGEGNGQPGQGEGSFSFQTDLDGKVLVRKNHTVFPETVKSAVKVHDDLLYVYASSRDGNQEAIYFDNEGNTIKYKVSFTENSIVLTSEKSSSSPRFRLSYTKIDDTSVKISFEMAQPNAPETFRTYLEGKANKIK